MEGGDYSGGGDRGGREVGEEEVCHVGGEGIGKELPHELWQVSEYGRYTCM